MSKRVVIVAGSLLVTGALMALALGLGDWAYVHRRTTLHHGRLVRLVEQQPSLETTTEGLAAEDGVEVLPVPPDLAALERRASGWPAASSTAVMAAARRHPHVRLFAVDGFVYVLFFDEGRKLRDFVLVPVDAP